MEQFGDKVFFKAHAKHLTAKPGPFNPSSYGTSSALPEVPEEGWSSESRTSDMPSFWSRRLHQRQVLPPKAWRTWSTNLNRQLCKHARCFSRALRKDAVWNPKLDCEGKTGLPTLVTFKRNIIDNNALSSSGPTILNTAMAFKERAGKEYVKDITQWDHAIVYRELWNIDLKQTGVHKQKVKVKVAQELGNMYRMSRDAGNWTYATMFDAQDWDAITSDPAVGVERNDDLADVIMAFGGVAPVYPGTFQQWANNAAGHAHRDTQQRRDRGAAVGEVTTRGVLERRATQGRKQR